MIRYLPRLIDRARRSPRWLVVLNVLLGVVIPFNRPHGFRIEAIDTERVRAAASYRRVNCNHVRGIHACAIATVAELSAGMLLLSRLDPARYRLIMARIEVDYRYQAKAGIVSESHLTAAVLASEILEPLQTQESVQIRVASLVSDRSGNEIAVAHTTWQIKRWDRVRTKV